MIRWVTGLLKKKEFWLCLLAITCGILFCGMGTYVKVKYPFWETITLQWDKATDLREFLVSMLFCLMGCFLWILSNNFVFLKTCITLLIGIFTADCAEKYHHYIDEKYKTNGITKEDWIVLIITIIVTFYPLIKSIRGQYSKTIRKN